MRDRFPILKKQFDIDGEKIPLVYFDNAATTQKPETVIRRILDFYTDENSNVHRSIHLLGEEATLSYENARKTAAGFIGCDNWREIVFTKGTTDSINLAAWAWGRKHLSPGDGILVTQMEHHSNLVPWQLLAKETGAELHHIPVTEDGELDLSDIDVLLSKGIKITAVTWVSNVLGTVNPVDEIIRRAHAAGSLVLVDAAQGAAHLPVDVKAMDCDFLAFSAHKMYGPTGTGVLYAKEQILETMDPYQGGGDMISAVWLDRAEWNEVPYKFEAGTPNIAGVLGMESAIVFINEIGFERIMAVESELEAYLASALSQNPKITRYGTAAGKGPVESFNIEGIHPHDAAHVLAQYGIAVRAGHHCAHPLMRRYGVPATVRASLAVYNTKEEIDIFVEKLDRTVRFFS